jgi:hypothetical protein
MVLMFSIQTVSPEAGSDAGWESHKVRDLFPETGGAYCMVLMLTLGRLVFQLQQRRELFGRERGREE